MLGRSHALSGAVVWLAGSAAAAMVAPPDPVVVAVGGVVSAGSALLPDMDHPSSHAARTLGPVSRAAARTIAWVCARVHAATRIRCRVDCDRVGCRTCPDRVDQDGHRTLAHTAPACLLLGAVTAGAGWWWGRLAAVVIVAVTAGLATRALLPRQHQRTIGAVVTDLVSPARIRRGPFGRHLATGWRRRLGRTAPAVGVLAVSIAAGTAVWYLPTRAWWWLGLPVAVGSTVHLLGDACTNSGCPILWPARIRGRRWYPVGTPRQIRFDTGSTAETVVFWVIAAAGAFSLYVMAT